MPMRMELVIRFDYGSIVPWVRRRNGALQATAGPDTLELRTTHCGSRRRHDDRGGFWCSRASVYPSPSTTVLRMRRAQPIDPERALRSTQRRWRKWSGAAPPRGRGARRSRSLITLKALTYYPTGGIVAAPTTSLPEQPNGVRNWDYRYCWLRDSTFTLNALLHAGYHEEASSWLKWLSRAVAGKPEDLQTLYSITGRRRLDEYELSWLPGYCGAAPVRIGNAASRQFQLDIYGEVMDTLHLARAAGLELEAYTWRIQVALLEFLESHWRDPDEGIWEVRGPRRHFTHSKVMAWVAFDRAIKDVEAFGLEGPVAHWREVRAAIHAEVCARGYDARRNTFVQSYESPLLDASLLLVPQVGFLPPDDSRVRGTVEAIERHLVVDGLVLRYSTDTGVDAQAEAI